MFDLKAKVSKVMFYFLADKKITLICMGKQ